MSDKLRDAVSVLLEQLEDQQKQVVETKNTINALLRRMGDEPMFDDVESAQGIGFKIRSDEYYTKPLATAVTMFLKRRNQPAGLQEILAGLQQGGFDFKRLGWKDSDRLRILASSVAKNTKVFHRVPGGTFGLIEWYDLEREEPEDRQATPTAKSAIVSKAAKVAKVAKAAAAGANGIPTADGKSTAKEQS